MSRDSWLKRLIWLRGSPAGGSGASYEKTVGPAPIISISDAKPKPAKSLIVGMEPIQDLHGYESPWPAGGGKNLWNGKFVNSAFVESDTYSASYPYIGNTAMPIEVGKQYIASVNGSAIGIRYQFLDSNKTVLADLVNAEKTDAAPNDAAYLRWRIRQDEGSEKGQIEAGSTATAWAPYSNICPITGRTGVTVERTGTNLFDATSYPLTSGYINSSDGSVSAGGTSASKTVDYIPCGFLAGGTITINHRPGYGYSPGIAFYDADKTFISGVANNGSTSTDAWSMSVPSAAQYMRITVPYGQENIQIELGSTASDYSEYSGATYPVTWQDEAGTVYGGTVDLVSGVLTVTHGMVDLGTLSWVQNAYVSTAYNYQLEAMEVGGNQYGDPSNIVCSAYKTNAIAGAVDLPNMAIMVARASRILVIRDDRYVSSPSSMKTALSGVMLCYLLATPQTYQLTPQQIQLLKGSNTLWSDGDSLTLTYLGTTPANLLGGMLGGGFGGGYNPPAEQDPEELTEPEATETDEPTKETPAGEGENNGE